MEIGAESDHVHFLIQSVPSLSPTKIVTVVKSITAREIFSKVPTVKEQLWGGEFWSAGKYIGTVGEATSEKTIRNYIRNQSTDKKKTETRMKQLKLFSF